MTVDDFLMQRSELPDAGQWSELVRGVPVTLEPPDPSHGTTVFNFSKAIGNYLQQSNSGYACFDLGLIVSREPDTIRFPAVSFYTTGPRFAEADKEVTSTIPAWIVEIISTADRRRGLPTRLEQYFDLGVQLVWALDPRQKCVQIWEPQRPSRTYGETDRLAATPVAEQFEVRVSELFFERPW